MAWWLFNVPIAKKAANALHCSSFRSILLANVIAKTHHRLLRDKLTPAFKEYKPELQSGQLPGTGVDSLILLVRTYQLRAQHHGMCFSMTYYDVQSAFYRVVREALLPTASDAESGERFLALLHNLAVPPEALRELVQAPTEHGSHGRGAGFFTPPGTNCGPLQRHLVQTGCRGAPGRDL